MARELANKAIAMRAEALWRIRQEERRARVAKLNEQRRANQRALFLEQLRDGVRMSGLA